VIKARGTAGNGKEFVLLGLSHENVARLFADEPIVVRTAEPPPSGVSMKDGPTIILMAGTDEETMAEKLRAAGLVTGTVVDD
jgi:hypothetical protein